MTTAILANIDGDLYAMRLVREADRASISPLCGPEGQEYSHAFCRGFAHGFAVANQSHCAIEVPEVLVMRDNPVDTVLHWWANNES